MDMEEEEEKRQAQGRTKSSSTLATERVGGGGEEGEGGHFESGTLASSVQACNKCLDSLCVARLAFVLMHAHGARRQVVVLLRRGCALPVVVSRGTHPTISITLPC